MKVLIVGSGGREHALAWKISQSPRLERLYIAPGNAGTAKHGENIPIPAEDIPALAFFAVERALDLVIVGPEAPLAAGLADELHTAGVPVFGPSRYAAQLESSKAFAKEFMTSHGIPTARFAVFSDYDAAAAYLADADYPLVIKASGLAAGKGVIVPADKEKAAGALRAIMLGREFGEAGDQVVLEERQEGEEVSLLSFSDGLVVRPMPPAQDHKRLLEGDKGPNTGGMGSYAPTPFCPPELVEELTRSVLQPAVDGLREHGHPYVGVLYAGLMLTSQGPCVLEYNCRFGDPETQAILPLLEGDLLEIALGCVEGRLGQLDIGWKDAAAACVVMASEGYPGSYPKGRVIEGLEQRLEDAVVFHAGTQDQEGQVQTSGGRVLSVTGWGDDLKQALARAYQAVEKISFEGMQFREDIGYRALEAAVRSGRGRSSYSQAGVDIQAGILAVDLIKEAVRSTYGPEVLGGIGAFGGSYNAERLKGMEEPVLFASTDGVGTKVKLAAQFSRYQGIGQDIVNHCINDILVQGAFPLFFLDYFATSRLKPLVVAEIVEGMVQACREAECAILGGETAEMPSVYAPGEFDVVGTIVGAAEREDMLPRQDLNAGDILVGLASSGPHTNGYTLIRKAFADIPLDQSFPELEGSLLDALLAPHRSYLSLLKPLLGAEKDMIKALVHITGGGFFDNIPRVLPSNLDALVHRESWTIPPVFRMIQKQAAVDGEEMYHVFNMGIGMIAVVEAEDASAFRQALPENTWVIGELVTGEGKVVLV